MKVSIVSVSRFAAVPHLGQGTLIQDSFWARGDAPRPVSSTSSGKITGKSAWGTGTMPHLGQWITGIGQPQYLWREINQSRKR